MSVSVVGALSWTMRRSQQRFTASWMLYWRRVLTQPETVNDIIVVAASVGGGTGKQCSKQQHNPEVKTLFEQRSQACDVSQRKQFSKQLWKAIRRQGRQRQDGALEMLVKTGAGKILLKLFLNQRSIIIAIRDVSEIFHTDGPGMAEAFAGFYESLHKEVERMINESKELERDLTALLSGEKREEVS